MRTSNKSWQKSLVFIAFGSCTLLAGAAFGETPEPPGLLSTLPGKSPAVLPAQAIDGRARAVNINYGQLRSGRIFLSLPDGVSFEAVRDHQQEWGPGRFDWVGHAAGDQANSVVIGVSGNSVAGAFTYEGRLFKLEPRADGSHVVSEVLTTDPAPELDPIAVADTASGSTGGAATAPLAAGGGGSVIDVMVAYTPSVKTKYGVSGTDALIIQAVAETNQAYANSAMTTRLNLVHTVLTAYTESGDMVNDLARLRSTSDGYMDELHALRNTYGADLVSLIQNDQKYCGFAYRMTSLSTSFASSAFSVVHHSCATGNYTFGHELGHNQGAHHDQNNGSGAIYPYAYGYQEPFNAFRTVMAYNCSSNCTRIKYFSNPDVLYNGKPTGQDNYADNARTIDTTATTVAAFRAAASQQAAASVPAAPSGLVAETASASAVALTWIDASTNESGFHLQQSVDGLSFTQIASLPANSESYTHDALQADTLYSYRVRAWNSTGNSGYSQVATVATDPVSSAVDHVASADLPVAGTVTGSYKDTWSANGLFQTIMEKSGVKSSGRYGYLSHKWTIPVKPGNSVVLFANVKTSATTDSFTFAYSTDNSKFIDMFVVNAGSSGQQQFALPASLNGTLYVRVKDNTRTAGQETSHTVQVDDLRVVVQSSADAAAPDAQGGVSAAATTDTEQAASAIDLEARGYKERGQHTVDLTWSGVLGSEVDIYRDGSLLLGAVANNGSFTDNTDARGAGSYAYEVCEAGTTTCSRTAGVVF